MNIRISIGISCLLIHPQPPRLSIRRGRSDAIGGVLRRNLSLHHSTAQTAGKENRRFRAYPNLRARDGRLTFRMSGQEPELCSTMVYKDDRTGRGPAATADKCHLNLLFLSLVRARHAGHAQQPAARPARPARPISPRPIVRFLEKNLYLPALTRPNLLQAPKHDIYRRAVDICLRAVDICRIRSQQNADPDILSQTPVPISCHERRKTSLRRTTLVDIGRHPIPLRYPFRRRLRRPPRTQLTAPRTGGPETRTLPRSRPISGRRPSRNRLAVASAEAYNDADERPIPTA